MQGDEGVNERAALDAFCSWRWPAGEVKLVRDKGIRDACTPLAIIRRLAAVVFHPYPHDRVIRIGVR